MSSYTDIIVEVDLDQISILPLSEMKLYVPKEQLRLSGGGLGKCVVDSQGKRNIGDCKATVDEKGDFILSTG